MTRVNNRAFRVVAQLFVLLLTIVVCSCSPTHKILKSGSPEMIYDQAVKLYHEEEWKRAIQLFSNAEPYYLGTNREDSLLFFKARCYYKDNDFETATQLLDEFRRTYGRSVFLEDAEGMYTMSYYYLSPAPDRDQSITKIAITAIDEFVSRHPGSAQIETFLGIKDELIGRLHKKSFLNAYVYFKIGRYKSSIVAFRNAMKEYPDSEYREEISFYIVASTYELAHNSVVEKKEDRYLSMIDSYYTFVAEFPDSKRRAEVDKMLKEARAYIAKMKENEGKDQSEERVLFWKKIFGKKKVEDVDKASAKEEKRLKKAEKIEKIEKVEIEETTKLD